MNVALIQNAEHDIDGHDRGKDEPELVLERGLEGQRGAPHQVIVARRTDDLQGDRQAVRGKAARYRGCWLLRQVERIGIGRPVDPLVAEAAVGRPPRSRVALAMRKLRAAGEDAIEAVAQEEII